MKCVFALLAGTMVACQPLTNQYSDITVLADLQERAMELEPALGKSLANYLTDGQDTLWSLAREYNPGVTDREELGRIVGEIKRINGLDSDFLTQGEALKIPTTLRLPASALPGESGALSESLEEARGDSLALIDRLRQEFGSDGESDVDQRIRETLDRFESETRASKRFGRPAEQYEDQLREYLGGRTTGLPEADEINDLLDRDLVKGLFP